MAETQQTHLLAYGTTIATDKQEFEARLSAIEPNLASAVRSGAVHTVDVELYTARHIQSDTTIDLMQSSDTKKVGITNVNNRKLERDEARREAEELRKQIEELRTKIDDMQKQMEELQDENTELQKLRPKNSMLGISISELGSTLLAKGLQKTVRANAGLIGKLMGVDKDTMLGMIDGKGEQTDNVPSVEEVITPSAEVEAVEEVRAEVEAEKLKRVEL